MVSIPACHAGDRGSIPRRGELFFDICQDWWGAQWFISNLLLNGLQMSFLWCTPLSKKNPPRRGIEPRSPAWQAGILTTILSRIAMIFSEKKVSVADFCVTSLVMYFLYSLCIVWGTSMMMEQDLFALPKTQMSVDWKYTLFSNLQDIDNLLKKCSFKHNVLL